MNLDDLLNLTPSKEGKTKIIVNAVEKGSTTEPEHLKIAMAHYENIHNYLKAAEIAEQLDDKEMAELYRSCSE